MKNDPALKLAETLNTYVAGLDEVGRGPLAGPVYAAAVVLNPEEVIEGLNDSKKLSAKKRNALYLEIREKALAVGVGIIEAPGIDQMNILQASLEAMRLAFLDCQAQFSESIGAAVIDGNKTLHLPAAIVQECHIGGDGLSAPIMAASIIAKVLRDRRMLEEAENFPIYGFEKHKGYPTKYHREALDRYGPCSLHRKSFAPVRRALKARE